jgi:hypothetical protein
MNTMENQNELGKVLTLQETAVLLRVSPWTVRRYIYHRQLHRVKGFGHIRILRSEVEEVQVNGLPDPVEKA